MNEEMKNFIDGKLVINVSYGKLKFSKTIPEIFKVQIKMVRIDEHDPKNVIVRITISQQSKRFNIIKNLNISINTNNLLDEEKEYIKTHIKDETTDWLGSRFIEDFLENVDQIVKEKIPYHENDQIFFEPDKFDQLIDMIINAVYCNDNNINNK